MTKATQVALRVHGDSRPAWLLGYNEDIMCGTYIHSRIDFGILFGRYWEYDPRWKSNAERNTDRAYARMEL